MVHQSARARGQERVAELDRFYEQPVRPAGPDRLAAAQSGTRRPAYYGQADTQLWDEMVSLPLFAEPAALAWSRTIGGVTPTPRSDAILWYAQLWAVRAPESTSNTTPSLPGQ